MLAQSTPVLLHKMAFQRFWLDLTVTILFDKKYCLRSKILTLFIVLMVGTLFVVTILFCGCYLSMISSTDSYLRCGDRWLY